MKLVKITMELGIDDDTEDDLDGDKDRIANYLNNKLYMDPEFFGEFGSENIVEVRDLD